MKRFLWFNLYKLKSDVDYFLITFLFLILVQLSFYFPLNGTINFKDLVGGVSTSVFFIYVLFCKKTFKVKDVWKCFWKDN